MVLLWHDLVQIVIPIHLRAFIFAVNIAGDYARIHGKDPDTIWGMQKVLDGFQKTDHIFRRAAIQIVHQENKSAILMSLAHQLSQLTKSIPGTTDIVYQHF